MSTILQDFRFGLRMLTKNPGFTAVAIITLALGIGANTAIFSVVNTVLLSPLPFAKPGQLVSLQQKVKGQPDSGVSYPNLFDWRTQNNVFSHIAGYHGNDFTLTGIGDAVHLPGEIVTWDLFQLLGTHPLLGRGFLPQEEKAGSHVVVLSYSLWRSRFKSNPGILEHAITLNGKVYTVVGIMPAGFQFPVSAAPPAFWTTCAVDAENNPPITPHRGWTILSVIARLKPGVTLTGAEADLNVIQARLAKQYPADDSNSQGVDIRPELQDLVQNVRLGLLVLLGAVGCVLLIACANVANLLLSRSATRSKEIAIRAALGAGRRRVIRQLLTESFLLSLCGTALGLLIAVWGTAFLLQFAPVSLPRGHEIGIDGRVLIFAIALAFVTAIIFGVVPAFRVSKPDLVESLKEGGRGAADASRHHRLRAVLVAAETAVALVLLAGAGLLIASYVALAGVQPGFNSQRVLTFTFQLPDNRYTGAQKINFYDQFLARLRAAPGIRSASAIDPLPDSSDTWTVNFQIQGRPVPFAQEPVAGLAIPEPGYFHTMGIPILRGREFSETDTATAPPVVVISKAFADRYFPNQNPLGKHIQLGPLAMGPRPWREIVGVVGDVHDRGLAAETRPMYYGPDSQLQAPSLTFVVRSAGNPRALVGTIRRLMASMDRNIPIYNVETMSEYLSASVVQLRFNTLMLGIFAALALALAAVGLYGVISYSVVQRTHEFGIRMALGAQQETILKLVLREGVVLVLAGVGIGLVGALGLTRLMGSLLYGVKPTDPATLVIASLVLIAVALIASYIPARRATKVDPMAALRCE
ncbi:MAG TPA: ABC transporter permease [Terriglobia bacterium]|nr:ABC transporter permease [Terriglobia bacterium]